MLDTELMDSLREDLAAAGIPRKREAPVPSGYRFEPPPSKPSVRNEELESIENFMEIDSMDIDPMEVDEEESLEPELPVSDYSAYDYESDQEMIQPSSPVREQYNPSNTPLIKVSQQIEEYDPRPTTASDGSYPGDDDDEGFSVFEESIIIPDPPFSHADPVSPQQQHSSGFRDDELLAEQVSMYWLLRAFG